jgi:hypothetical protein
MTDEVSPLRQYFRATRNEMLAGFEKSGGINHKGERGSARESFVQSFLAKSFPRKFVFDTGEIIDGDAKVGPQSDVVIYDESLPILHYGSTNRFISEGVLSHIEVKSNAASSDIKDALQKVVAVKSLAYNLDPTMWMDEIRTNIASFVFAYECPTSKESFKESVGRYYADNNIDNGKVVDGFFVLRQGLAIINVKGAFAAIEPGEDILLIAFVRIFNAIQKTWTAYPNFDRYLGGTTATTF